jgi:pimeloyl-ACP methyl ester carboxylesterase
MATSIKTVQGTAMLAFDSVHGITNSVEHMHDTIAHQSLVWAPDIIGVRQAHGLIASSVYTIIRGVNSALRQVTGLAFDLAPDSPANPRESDAELRAVAAMNGVFGDHLEATSNPLAIPMQLRSAHQQLEMDPAALSAAIPDASAHLVVLVHGLSLSELCWNRGGKPGIGSRLQNELGYTPLYLRYNTGRHISTNGQEFTGLLQQLCEAWPVPVKSISLVGHSMGGLVIRSACWHAAQQNHEWLPQLRRVVCLGTPHHGSPLERAGHALDSTMQKIPYLAPLAFGKHRSAGIKDLRHGNLLDEDWQDIPAHQSRMDNRRPVPLLPDVDYYLAAATVGAHRQDPRGKLFGDLLVRVDSAVGAHKNTLKKLHIKPENCEVFHDKNHLDLLDDERVHQKLIQWFQ